MTTGIYPGAAPFGERAEPSRAEVMLQAGRLRVRSVRRDGARIVIAVGELDSATAQSLSRELARAEGSGAASVTLDLAGLTFIDAAGIRLLHELSVRDREGRPALSVVGPGPQLQRVLELGGLDSELLLAA